MTDYDANIIQEFADRLYKKASAITFQYAFIGAILVGGALGAAVQQPAFAGIGLFIGALIGAMMGREKAFQYRLQAQTALCQAQIAANTSRP